MGLWRSLACIVALGQPVAGTALAQGMSGNGGDPLRFRVRQSIEAAQVILGELEGRTAGEGATTAEQLLFERASELRAALRRASLTFSHEPGSSCAMAYVDPEPRLVYFYQACRTFQDDPLDLRLLALHEAVHLIGIGDEDLADEVALTAVRLWGRAPAARGVWNDLGAASSLRPKARSGAAAAYAPPFLVVAGGTFGPNRVVTPQVDRFDLTSGQWLPPLLAPAPLLRPGVFAIGGRDMLVEARGQRTSPVRFKFDVHTGAFTSLAAPAAFAAPLATARTMVGDWVVELGNADGVTTKDRRILLGTRTDWRTGVEQEIRGHVPFGLSIRRPLTVALGSRVLMIAEDAERQPIVAAYDPSADAWSALSNGGMPRFLLPLPTEPGATHAVALARRALVIGRLAGRAEVVAQVYDEVEDVWASVSLPEPLATASQIVDLVQVGPAKVAIAYRQSGAAHMDFSVLDVDTDRTDPLTPLFMPGLPASPLWGRLFWAANELIFAVAGQGESGSIDIQALRF